MTKTTSNTTRKTKTSAAKPAKAAGRSKPDSDNPADQLSDLQLVALSAACQREDRTIAIPDALEDEAIPVFAETLINLGLAEETPAERGQPVWRQDQVSGQPITLCITDRALTVLGIDEGNPETGMGDTEVVGPSIAAPVVSHTSEGGRNVTDPLKAAGRARKANAVVSGPGATPAQPRRTEPPQPRAGSKQGQLIAMLSCKEGVSISEIATALGWLPHTTRAALTGLRHKGYELEREIKAERGSLYRITAMPIAAPSVTNAIQAEAA